MTCLQDAGGSGRRSVSLQSANSPVQVRVKHNPRGLVSSNAALCGVSPGAADIRASAPRSVGVQARRLRSRSEPDLCRAHRIRAVPTAAKTESTIIPADTAMIAPMRNPINSSATPMTTLVTRARRPTMCRESQEARAILCDKTAGRISFRFSTMQLSAGRRRSSRSRSRRPIQSLATRLRPTLPLSTPIPTTTLSISSPR